MVWRRTVSRRRDAGCGRCQSRLAPLTQPIPPAENATEPVAETTVGPNDLGAPPATVDARNCRTRNATGLGACARNLTSTHAIGPDSNSASRGDPAAAVGAVEVATRHRCKLPATATIASGIAGADRQPMTGRRTFLSVRDGSAATCQRMRIADGERCDRRTTPSIRPSLPTEQPRDGANQQPSGTAATPAEAWRLVRMPLAKRIRTLPAGPPSWARTWAARPCCCGTTRAGRVVPRRAAQRGRSLASGCWRCPSFGRRSRWSSGLHLDMSGGTQVVMSDGAMPAADCRQSPRPTFRRSKCLRPHRA